MHDPSEISLTIERLRGLIHYDPATGLFTRLMRMGKFPAGTVAGSVGGNGYRRITIEGTRYYAHRLAWFYLNGEWPSADIDHRGLNRDDNRASELRPASRPQNMQNGRKRRHNKSGFKGVSWDSKRRLWRATIQISGKWKQIGRFQTAEAAHQAYAEVARRNFGEFARAA